MTESSASPARPRVVLTDISSRAWEHPADRGALIALRKLKGFDSFFKAVSGFFGERANRLMLLGSAVKVDERQFPTMHRLLLETAQVLDAENVPELYVVANPYFNAHTIGLNTPIITVHSALVDLLDTEEMRFVIGHELGHALSGHAVYNTMLKVLIDLSGLLTIVPGGVLGARGIRAALMEWSRKSELSADRAGLLSTQDPAAAIRTLMKLASGGHLEDLDQTSFFDQGREYDESGDIRESFWKLLLIEKQTHPWSVLRAAELRRWIDSGQYTATLGGSYPRRDEDAAASASEAAQEAARGYQEQFRSTGDTLGKLVHDLAGFAGSARSWLDETLRGPRT